MEAFELTVYELKGKAMHLRVYKELEKVCSERKVSRMFLEVGVVPRKESLLCMNWLEKAAEKIGVKLDGAYEFRDFGV